MENSNNNNNMTIEEKINFMLNLKSGVTMNVVTETIPTMNKKGNDYIGRVIKRTEYKGVFSGCEYMHRLEKEAARMGIDISDYKPRESYYRPYQDGNLNLLVLKSNNERLYGYFGYEPKNPYFSMSVTYYVDGRPAKMEEFDQFSQFFPKKEECKKQADAGLSGRHQRPVFTTMLENIISIRYGETFAQLNPSKVGVMVAAH